VTFLSDIRARINVGSGIIRFRIGKRNLKFKFQDKEEKCYLVQDSGEQFGGRTELLPPRKKSLSKRLKEIRKEWQKIEMTPPSTSQEWGAEWN
jgi:hypothetical protein